MKNAPNKRKFWNYTLIVFTVIVLLFGLTLKMLHSPGSGIILVSGIVFFAFSSLIYFYQKSKAAPHQRSKAMTLPILLALLLYFTGAIFKIMHFPGAGPMFIIALLMLLVFYLIRFFKKPVKKFLDYLKLSIVLLYCLQGGRVIFGGVPFLDDSDLFVSILRYGFWALIMVWFVMQGFTYFSKEENPKVNYFSNALFALALVLIFHGAYIRMQGESNSVYFIIVGLVVGVFWTFYGYFFENKEGRSN